MRVPFSPNGLKITGNPKQISSKYLKMIIPNKMTLNSMASNYAIQKKEEKEIHNDEFQKKSIYCTSLF